jgi:hypothetical protein
MVTNAEEGCHGQVLSYDHGVTYFLLGHIRQFLYREAAGLLSPIIYLKYVSDGQTSY